MAAGCRDLMCLFTSIMILATQFVIPAQAATKTQAQDFTSTSGQLLKVQRSSFSKHFVFGTSSSAYQYEGAAMEDGKGLSIWDTYSHTEGTILGNTTGDIAVDQYHRFEEDIWLMKNLGMDAYRFSIAWSRILPHGTGKVNWEGVTYYNKLIDALLAHDTLGGWLNAATIDAYAEFARLSFQLFGDRVKHWITFNEIYEFARQGYSLGVFPPGRCSPAYGNCTAGNSSTEPYIVAHNSLNAHAEAVRIYRSEFKKYQHGVIGMTVDSAWYEPLQNNSVDRNASNRAMEFDLGWFLDPLFFGEYPTSMQLSLGTRLPQFTAEEKDRIKGSYDFVGYNHYTSYYATVDKSSASNDNRVTSTSKRNGTLIGPQTASKWHHVVPYGMRKSLAWIRTRYNNPIVYITECGYDDTNTDATQSLATQLNDHARITYHHDYLRQVLVAISEESNVQGYFAWSFLDNFEWFRGYTLRFGIYYVDYNNNQARYPKASAHWFSDMLSK